MLPGHYATERLGVEMLVRWLSEQEWSKESQMEVWASKQEKEPLKWV